jgi:hypothetical protein
VPRWAHLEQLLASGIVEVKHRLWLLLKALDTRQTHGIVLLLHTILVSECIQSALLADASTGEYYYLLA